jgi:UDP-glucose 4-epimerase
VYVEDVVEANLAAMGQDIQGTYNVGTGEETSVNDLLGILVRLTNSTCKEVHGPAKGGEQARSVIDSGKLRHELSWESRTELSEGLKHTVDYFRERMG